MREEIYTKPANNTCNCPNCGLMPTDIEEVGKKGGISDIIQGSHPRMRRRSTRVNLELEGALHHDMSTMQLNSSFDSSGIADTLTFCACQQSRTYPYCDNTHKTFNKETNSSISPIILTFVEESNNKITEPTPKDLRNNTNNTLYNTDPISPDTHSLPCTDPSSSPDIHVKQAPKYKPTNIKDPINRHNVFTKEEVAEHCTLDSLWMIIKGNVYDITEYVPSHPGATRALMNFAGKDGTDNVQYHSPKMLEILNSNYFVGKLQKEEASGGCIIS